MVVAFARKSVYCDVPHAALASSAPTSRLPLICTSVDRAATGKAANNPVALLKTSGVVCTAGSSSRRSSVPLSKTSCFGTMSSARDDGVQPAGESNTLTQLERLQLQSQAHDSLPFKPRSRRGSFLQHSSCTSLDDEDHVIRSSASYSEPSAVQRGISGHSMPKTQRPRTSMQMPSLASRSGSAKSVHLGPPYSANVDHYPTSGEISSLESANEHVSSKLLGNLNILLQVQETTSREISTTSRSITRQRLVQEQLQKALKQDWKQGGAAGR